MLFLEQLNTQLSARSLGYAALTLYIAAVIVEVVRRLVSGKRRPPKVFMMMDLPLPIIGPLINLHLFVTDYNKIDHEAPWTLSCGSRIIRSPRFFGTSVSIIDVEGIKIAMTSRHNGRRVLSTQPLATMQRLFGRTSLLNVGGAAHTRLKKLMHPTLGVSCCSALLTADSIEQCSVTCTCCVTECYCYCRVVVRRGHKLSTLVSTGIVAATTMLLRQLQLDDVCMTAIKVLATFVPEMALACDKFMTDVIESKLSSSSSGSGSATEQALSATAAVYEPVRRFLIEMPLRLILGLGDTAPEVVSHHLSTAF
eukprot:9783-Heterococcus_DN1.PRE.1